jgi:uncharacterized Rmd1/YagE family protein
MHPIAQSGKASFKARALLVGERIDVRSLGSVDRLASDPITLSAGAGGIAVLFRYGAVVLFDVAPLEEGEFLRQLRPLVHHPYAVPEMESLEIRIDASAREGIEAGTMVVADCSLERLQLVADVLSKSTVLAMYEAKATASFDLIEPFALDLTRNAWSHRNTQELLRSIGGAMLSEHNMVGRVEVVDKPELLWEHPGLERFYERLLDEFEIRERHVALERKLELVSRTAQTVLDLLQARRSFRLEWYVVLLILVEIIISLVQIFFSRH